MTDAVTLGEDQAFQPVPNAVFSLDSVLRKERYDLWRESISCIFEVDGDRESRSSDTFKAEIDATMFGPIMLARTQTMQQDWRRSASVRC